MEFALRRFPDDYTNILFYILSRWKTERSRRSSNRTQKGRREATLHSYRGGGGGGGDTEGHVEGNITHAEGQAGQCYKH